MLQHIKNLLERNATLIAILTTIIIAVLSLKTISIDNPLEISFFDKILHFSAYFVLTSTWLFSQRLKNNGIIIIIAIFLYGALLEFCQGWFAPNRTKDYADIVANSAGILFAALLFKYIYNYLKKTFGNTN